MSPSTPPIALTVAGSDSSGGAGIQADLRTFHALGVWGASAITAVTAQSSRGVHLVHQLPGAAVRAQIDAVASDNRVGAVKTGMLATAEIVEAVASAVADHRFSPLVVDPVRVATRGGLLLEPSGAQKMVRLLFPLCTLVTPNLPEAEALLGRPVTEEKEMLEAVRALAALGPESVLLKGGHLSGDRAPDLLWHQGVATWIDGPRIRTGEIHGTGCTLSAAITAYLALGLALPEACSEGKGFVTGAIAAGVAKQGSFAFADPSWNRGNLPESPSSGIPHMPSQNA